MIKVDIMTKRKRSEHYVNNKDFLDAMIKYKEQLEISKIQGTPKPPVPHYIGECFLKIANHLSYKPNFVNYMFKEDMISDGIENCLHRSTIIPTIEYGPIEIEKLVGKEVTVRCKDGEWRKAYGKSYGRQMLYEYGFSFNEKVIATENHRWFVSNRKNEESVVTDLKIGDCLVNAIFKNEYDKQSILDGVSYSLYPKRNFLPSVRNSKYIFGFILGWSLETNDSIETAICRDTLDLTIHSQSDREWLAFYAPYVGYYISSQNENSITLSKINSLQFKVENIKEYGEDEVFCLEEPVTNSFVLGNGLLTGNCLQYIHNFNPEKSQNPFAYFTQIIHYAFLRRIQREKRQMEIKNKILEKSGYSSVFEDDGGIDGSNYSDYNSIKDNVHTKLRY